MSAETTLTLRDIHLPAGISWWPPAPGWWVVAGVMVSLAVLGVWYYRRYQARCLQRTALLALEKIQAQYDKEPDDRKMIQALSIWLRRVCISYYPVAEVAGLTGSDWLNFLDQHLSGTSMSQAFSAGAGSVILTGPYQLVSSGDSAELLSLCRSWLMALPLRQGK